MGDIEQVEAVTIFGELFGGKLTVMTKYCNNSSIRLARLIYIFAGFYPHDSVEKVPGIAPIQKEVVYCPDLKFCGFDIALFRNGHERGK